MGRTYCVCVCGGEGVVHSYANITLIFGEIHTSHFDTNVIGRTKLFSRCVAVQGTESCVSALTNFQVVEEVKS